MKALYKLRIMLSKLVTILFLSSEVFRDRQKLLFVKTSHKSLSTNNELKLHIGCGQVNAVGWINLDTSSFLHVGIRTDDLSLSMFQDGSIDEIYMCHILEHFTFSDIPNLLSVFRKKLKSTGRLRLSVPDFDSIVTIYLQNNRKIDSIHMILMGGQNSQYNFHKSIFNHNSLASLLYQAGFQQIESWDPSHEFILPTLLLSDFSSYRHPTLKGAVPVSLNLVASC